MLTYHKQRSWNLRRPSAVVIGNAGHGRHGSHLGVRRGPGSMLTQRSIRVHWAWLWHHPTGHLKLANSDPSALTTRRDGDGAPAHATDQQVRQHHTMIASFGSFP